MREVRAVGSPDLAPPLLANSHISAEESSVENSEPDPFDFGPPSGNDWEARLARIDWSRYLTAYGDASAVEHQLRRLRSVDQAEALDATHDLWCGLCHQHVQIGSAALPALPFLLEAFSTASQELKIELLDIFVGLAITSKPSSYSDVAIVGGHDFSQPPWIAEVRAALEAALPEFLPLRTHADPDLSSFACRLTNELAATNPSLQIPPRLSSLLEFDEAVAEFTAFVVSRDYPPNLLWVQSPDVVLRRWTDGVRMFVWKANLNARKREVHRAYQVAVSRDVGVALHAHGKTERSTICSVFVPHEPDDAGRLMIGSNGATYKATVNPPPVTLVENRWVWNLVKSLPGTASFLAGASR